MHPPQSPQPPWVRQPPTQPLPAPTPSPSTAPDLHLGIAVAVLNATGLGLGYVLVRHWIGAAVSWAATIALVVIALPVHPDAIPRPVIIGYLVVLVAVTVHGAVCGLHSRHRRPTQSPVALVAVFALLLVPLGVVFWYTETTERMLLDRLASADRAVRTAEGKQFAMERPHYKKALDTYGYLVREHPYSRAAERVPDRLRSYYASVAAPYRKKEYCSAIDPLKHLKTLPKTMKGSVPADLSKTTDTRLATSLYECGISHLGGDRAVAAKGGNLYELLTTYPRSEQAAKVEPALADAIASAEEALSGDDPCTAVGKLEVLRDQANTLPGQEAGIADKLTTDHERAADHITSGTYTCGVDQYEDDHFTDAKKTMDDFADTYPDDGRVPKAEKISIAAEIAAEMPSAGQKLPTTAKGHGQKVPILNATTQSVEVLYTGAVTGRFTIGACSNCRPFGDTCKPGRSYPGQTIRLPTGSTAYFLQKSAVGNPSTYKTKIKSNLLNLCVSNAGP